MIKVDNLTKKFNGFTAVDSISFEVLKGEIFAFLGPNGAGKTTTIKVLTTLLLPTSGKVCLNGYDPTTNQDETRKSFGIVFQDPSLDDELTAYENMEFHGVLYKVPKDLREVVLVCDWVWGLEKRLNVVKWLGNISTHVRQIKSMGEWCFRPYKSC